MSEPEQIRFRLRALLVLAAWIIAAIATVSPYASLLKSPSLFFLFPYGLMTFLVWLMGWRAQQAPHFLFGWGLYLVLTAVGLASGRRRLYFVIYTLLCLFLFLNTVGCHMMFHGYPKT